MPGRSDPERDARALELHLAGASYAQIARAVGFAHKPAALKAVRRAMAGREVTSSAREAANMELLRLDAMLTGLWPKARRGDPEAVDRVLRIDRRKEVLRELLNTAPPPPTDRAAALSEFERRVQERKLGTGPPGT